MKTVFKALILTSIFALAACNKDKDILFSNEWIAASITQENGDFITPNSDYTLILESKSQFSLRLDVNLCGGKVYFRRQKVNFKDGIYCTEACCDSEFAIALVNNLDKTRNWSIVGNRLMLKNDKGLLIVFNRK